MPINGVCDDWALTCKCQRFATNHTTSMKALEYPANKNKLARVRIRPWQELGHSEATTGRQGQSE